MTTRIEIANQELTANPIFLLQRRVVVPHSDGYIEYDSDTDNFLKDGFPVSMTQLVDNDEAIIYWDTVSVFFTREEAEAHGAATAYHYPDGWRAYCVPAAGTLADLLNSA